MAIAAPFKLHNDYDDVIDEFNIMFDEKKNSLKNLIAFATEYQDRRINIEFIQGIDLSVLTVVNAVHPHIYARIKGADYFSVEELKKHNCKFFCDVSFMTAYNYTSLDTLVSLGVSDVYLSDDLFYNLADVRGYLQEHGVKSRLILNKIPCSTFDKGTNLRSPIFRPQDIDLLSKYIDTFEFDCGDPYQWNVFDVLYRSWFRDKNWIGDLREINLDLQVEFPNASIIPNYTKFKINCGRRCCSRKESKCDKCNQFVDIGVDLANKSIRIKEM